MSKKTWLPKTIAEADAHLYRADDGSSRLRAAIETRCLASIYVPQSIGYHDNYQCMRP